LEKGSQIKVHKSRQTVLKIWDLGRDSFSTIYHLFKIFSFKKILNTTYKMISWRARHLNRKSRSCKAVKFKRLYAKSSSQNNKTTPMLLKMFQTTRFYEGATKVRHE
jgi:hypothetical protein